MSERYLYEGEGPADEELRAVEESLRSLRWKGELEPLPEPEPEPASGGRPRRRPLARAAWRSAAALLAYAAAVALLFTFVARWLDEDPASSYRVVALRGAPQIGESGALLPTDGDGRALAFGESIACDANSRALVRVGELGEVVLEPAARVRVGRPEDGAPGGEYLLHLERGSLTASIFAAPRLFQVGTPAGIAVDLGCVYTASVQPDGRTRLSVVSGRVAFEAAGREVTVPAGASTEAHPELGVGAPLWDDASEAFRAALRRYEDPATSPEARASALSALIAESATADTLTLWHLLAAPRAAGAPGGGPALFARLAGLAPPPEGVTEAGCLAGDRAMLERWRARLSWGS